MPRATFAAATRSADIFASIEYAVRGQPYTVESIAYVLVVDKQTASVGCQCGGRRLDKGVSCGKGGDVSIAPPRKIPCWPAKKLDVPASCRSTKAGNNGWFTGGFDALALKEAKALLAGLAS